MMTAFSRDPESIGHLFSHIKGHLLWKIFSCGYETKKPDDLSSVSEVEHDGTVPMT